MAKVRNYKLIGGIHVDNNGEVYSRGMTVPSTEDLRKKFVGKFELVDDVRSPEESGDPDESGPTEKARQEVAEKVRQSFQISNRKALLKRSRQGFDQPTSEVSKNIELEESEDDLPEDDILPEEDEEEEVEEAKKPRKRKKKKRTSTRS